MALLMKRLLEQETCFLCTGETKAMPISYVYGAATKRPSNEAFALRSSSAADLKQLKGDSKEWKSARSIDQLSESISDCSDSQSLTSSRGNGRLLRDFSVEHIPTRLTNQTGPKLSYNPMQFVKTGPAVQLSQTAREQIEKAKELKKLRDVKKEDAEDWQANLDGWKKNRLKRQENVIERVKDVKRFEEEDAWKQAEEALERTRIKRGLRGSHDGHTSSFLSRYSEDAADLSENGEPEKPSFPLNSTVGADEIRHKEPVDDFKDPVHFRSQISTSNPSVNAMPVDHHNELPVKRPVAAPRRSLTLAEPVVPAPRRRSVKERNDVGKEETPAVEQNEEAIFPLKGAVTQRRSFFEPLPASGDDVQPFDINRKPGEFRHGLKKAADRLSTGTDKEPVELSTDASRTEPERQVPAADLQKTRSTRTAVVTDTTDKEPFPVSGSMEPEKTSNWQTISNSRASDEKLFTKDSIADTTDKERLPVPVYKPTGTEVPESKGSEKASNLQSISSPRTSGGSSFAKDCITDTTDIEPLPVPRLEAAGTEVPESKEHEKESSWQNISGPGTSGGTWFTEDSTTDTTDKVPELPKTQIPKSMKRDWEFTDTILPSSNNPNRSLIFKDSVTDITDKEVCHSPERKMEKTEIPEVAGKQETAVSEDSAVKNSVVFFTDKTAVRTSQVELDRLNATPSVTDKNKVVSAIPDKGTISERPQTDITDTADSHSVHAPESVLNRIEATLVSLEKTLPASGLSGEANLAKLENPGTPLADINGSEDSEWTEDEGIRSLSPEVVVKPDLIRLENSGAPIRDPVGKESTNQREAVKLTVVDPESVRIPEVHAKLDTNKGATELKAFDWLVGVAPKLAPPTEKPPPPPPPCFLDGDDDSHPAISSPPATLSVVSAKQEEIKLRDPDTVRNIRSELRKRRSDFLGFEVSTEEVSEVAAVPPPPDLKSIILQTDLRPSELKMFADQPMSLRDEPNLLRSGSVGGLDYAALAWKEQEIIRNLTEEQEFRRNCEGVPESGWETENIYEELKFRQDNGQKEETPLTNGKRADEPTADGQNTNNAVQISVPGKTSADSPSQAKPEAVKADPNYIKFVPTDEVLGKPEARQTRSKQHVTFSEPRRLPTPETITNKTTAIRHGPPTAPKNYIKPDKFFTQPVYENPDEITFRPDARAGEPGPRRFSPPRMREKTPYFVKPRPLSVMELHSNSTAVVAKRKPGTDGHKKDTQSHWLVQEAEHRRLFTDSNRSGPSHWKSMPSVAGIGLAPLPNARSISAAPQVPLQRTLLETTRSSSSLSRDDSFNQSQSKPVRTSTQVPEPRKEAIPVLPESIIDTLTRKAAQKNTARDVQQPRPAPQSLRNDYGKGSLPMQRFNEQSQERFLSISGRKKCSLCAEELGRGAAMIIESLQLFYHIACFRCTVCGLVLGNGTVGTDVRIRHNRLHCQDCYSTEGLKFSKV